MKYNYRDIVEKALNRKLASSDIIHHINGDKSDNRLENLLITDRRNHCIIHYYQSTERQNDWHNRIMKIGHRNKIKVQNPRPYPAQEGIIWHNHKMRKAWIVKKCNDCSILFWGRKDYKPSNPICIKCSVKNALKIRWNK